MKARILSLISLFALLLVSTAILADGRPTGIRIGSVTRFSASGVEINVTVPGTTTPYPGNSSFGGGNTSVWIGNGLGTTRFDRPVWQYVSSSFSVPLPWAIDWGDGYRTTSTLLTGPPGGPFTGAFQHTYVPAGGPQTYTIRVGDALCCSPVGIPSPSKGVAVTTGYSITGSTRYVKTWGLLYSYYLTFNTQDSAQLAVMNTASVTTGVGIPALNVYGLLAMAFLLVGTGLLVYRGPQRFAA